MHMLPTIVRNLLSEPPAGCYAIEDLREPFPRYRGRISFDPGKCRLCGDCARVCPAEAIEVSLGNSQITYDPFNCILWDMRANLPSTGDQARQVLHQTRCS